MKKYKSLALVVGAERTFGAELVAQLLYEGYQVEALPFASTRLGDYAQAKAEVLVVNAPVILPNIALTTLRTLILTRPWRTVSLALSASYSLSFPCWSGAAASSISAPRAIWVLGAGACDGGQCGPRSTHPLHGP